MKTTIRILAAITAILSASLTRATDLTGTEIASTFQLSALTSDSNLWDGFGSAATTSATIGAGVEYAFGTVSADFDADSLTIALAAFSSWGSNASFTFEDFDLLTGVSIASSDFTGVQVSNTSTGFSVFIPTQTVNSSEITSVQLSISPVPEPSTYTLLASLGCLTFAGLRRRRR